MILFILLCDFFESADVESKDAFAASAKAQKYANEKLSCWLEKPPADLDEPIRAAEMHEDYNPPRGEYERDNHPSSVRVDPRLDYSFVAKLGDDIGRLTIKDEKVKQDHRKIVLANNMHACCFTCHKYGHTLDCRFCFPFCVDLDATSANYTGLARLTSRMGRKHRVRNAVEAPRNNANANRHAAYPAILCCWRGNMDQTCAFYLLVNYASFCSLRINVLC